MAAHLTTVSFHQISIADRYVTRYPIAYNREEGIVAPIAAYIHYRAMNNVSEKTLEADAYCLAEYWDFLSSVKTRFSLITPDLLRLFLDNGAGRPTKQMYDHSRDVPIVYKDTIERKRGIIYNFYHVAQNHLEIVSNILAPKNVSKASGYRLPAIPVKVAIGVPRAKDDHNRSRHDARKAKERRRRPKPTPSLEESNVALETILQGRDTNRANTYFLAASLEVQSGARGCGVEDLTISALYEAFSDEPDLSKMLRSHLALGVSCQLSAASGTQVGAALIRGLKGFAAAGRRYVFAMVFEKGALRPLPIPIALALEILDYIWTERDEFVRRRQVRDPDFEPPDNVFLSYKTGRALQAGTIARIVSKALRKNGIPGTAHRLRATFAEQIVYDLYHKDRAANAGRPDFISIMELARELLGHTGDKAIRKYINNITKKDRLFKGHVVLASDAEDAILLKDISAALEFDTNGTLRHALASFLVSYRLQLPEGRQTS